MGGQPCADISEKLNVEHVTPENTCNQNIEGQWLKLKLPETRDTIIANIYKPPAGATKEALTWKTK